MNLLAFQGAIEQGLMYGLVALGLFVSYRILNVADLTVDGSFTLGAAVSVMMAFNGHPWLGILLAVLAGMCAGIVTGLLQTKLRVQPILAGILTMTALYSINIWVMDGKPNVNLIGKDTIYTPFKTFFDAMGWRSPAGKGWEDLVVSFLFTSLAVVLVVLFLKTQIGFAVRATGDNENMVRSSSINSDVTKLIGLAIANGSVGLAGAVLAQSQRFADASMGIGMVVIGLASLIIGEVILGHGGVLRGALAMIVGSILYRIIIAFVLARNVAASDLKLLSAVIVAVAISYPVLKEKIMLMRQKRKLTKGGDDRA